MPDIGETLRESRMRRRIDIAEVEAATKIRAKYLRALENEEWDLLPGPTFVKTFLRTYAEYLELDPRGLVDEYKQRFEAASGGEVAPFGGLAGTRPAQRRGRQRGRSLAAFGPVAVVGILAIALVVIFYVLGRFGQPNDVDGTPPRATATPSATPVATTEPSEPAAAKRVRMRLVATGDVYVCLVDASGKRLLDGVTLHAGERTDRFRSRLLRVNLGTSNVQMVVDGRRYPVARSADPVGYELRPGREPRRLPDARRPTCA
jgi:hypothetical protein